MRKNILILAAACAAVPFVGACSTDQGGGGGVASVGNETVSRTPVASGGTGTAAGTGTSAGAGGTARTGTGGIPALVNVNLQNVLNDLSVRLNVDRANIPVNAQVPIDVAANVCGVSVNVLSLSTGGKGSCTAKTATPQLAQVVQQQVAAGGSVGGGAQGGSTATTGGATGTGGASSSGSTGTTGTSSGTSEGTPPPPPPTSPH
ncbi:MAG: hypothetical protein QOH81_1303 [Sphingomonadales bacterium]|jgi:hypothetical protein|nr:hypothetical protein [Sphingomonadales bacterium]